MTETRTIGASASIGFFPQAVGEGSSSISTTEIVKGVGLTAGLLFLAPLVPRYAALPLTLGVGLLPLFLSSPAQASPASCYRKKTEEKKKKEEYSVPIAIFSIVAGSLLALKFRNTSSPVARFLFGTKFEPRATPTKLFDRLMAPLDKPFHYVGQVGLPIAAIEFGLRWVAGYNYHLSAVGGVCSMFFWNRVGIQYWGLDRSGASLMFLIDRFFDALPQIQSGENWRNVNWFYVANHYGSVTLFGTYRAKLARDWIYRRAEQRLIRSVALSSSSVSSKILFYDRSPVARFTMNLEQKRRGVDAVRAITREEQGIVSTLLRSSNWNNRVWITESGQFCDKTGRLLGSELTAVQREGLAVAMGKSDFASLFNPSQGMKLETVGAMRCLHLKVKGDANTLGFLAYWTIQEPIMSPPLVAIPASILCGEDFDKSAMSAFYKSFLQLPRQFFKLHMGIDTAAATFVDRVLKYPTETYLSKIIPLFASKGLWRKDYKKAVCADTLDEFVDFHLAPSVMKGGLNRYNLNILNQDNLPTTLLSSLQRIRFDGRSPYTPIPISYRLLAEFYADPKSLGDEEREAVGHFIAELVEEAKRRRKKERILLTQYQDETILDLAYALSAAAYYAHRKHSEYFAELVQKNKEWFDFGEHMATDLEALERFVSAL